MRRSLAAVLAAGVAALGLGSCGSSPSPGSSPPAPGHLRWVACRGGQGPKGVECATLTVPMDTTAPFDPAAPAGAGTQTVTLALDRVPATGTRIGSLVFNPGGPGVSAVDDLPGLAGELSGGVRRHFDVIGYDPPGVGHSTAVSCLSPPALAAYLHQDPAPPGRAGFARVAASARSFAAACRAAAGALLDHVSTLDAARDLDRVRAAVGDPTLNYLGFSYGTILGATYASLHPARVRSMVLDGALDPTLPTLDALGVQAAAVDSQFKAFAAACRTDSSCPWQPGADPTGSFLSLLAAARTRPVPAGGGRVAGPAEVIYGTAEALYSTQLWPDLERALGRLRAGRGDDMVALFDAYAQRAPDGTYSTVTEAESAVNCADRPAPALADVETEVTAVAAEAPIFGPANVDGEAVCAAWPAPGATGPHALSAPGAPIVVVGSTGDPITPYSWSVHLADQLGSARLLTRVGDGHTAYGASACVRSSVEAYLVDLRLPAPGTRCPSS